MIGRIPYLMKITEEHAFPQEAVEAFCSVCVTVANNPKANSIFLQQLMLYENDMMCHYRGSYNSIQKAARLCGIRSETALTVLFLCMTEHLRALYSAHGFNKAMFDDVVEDIKFKSDECFVIRGVYGTFVEDWFNKFFDLTRFAIGRLQYEPRFILSDIEVSGRLVEKDSFAIGIHIPSGTPLRKDECINSLKTAYYKFLPYFDDGMVVFYCGSWLLAPENRNMLPPTSNIVKFMDLFHILPGEEHISHDFWRVFGKEDCSDIKSLPRDNTMRRAYAEQAEKGLDPLSGIGLIFMKNGEFVL